MYAEYKRDMSHNYLIHAWRKSGRHFFLSGEDADRKCSAFYSEMSYSGTGWKFPVLL